MRLGEIGLDCQRLVIAGGSFIQPAQVLEGIAKVVVRLQDIGVEG